MTKSIFIISLICLCFQKVQGQKSRWGLDTLCGKIIVSRDSVTTPNGDGNCDFFQIQVLDSSLLKSLNLQIYGKGKVYDSFGFNHRWDGTSDNKALPNGLYFWLVHLEWWNLDDEKKYGNFSEGVIKLVR